MSNLKVSPAKAQRPPVALHSWELSGWPEDVWPHTAKRARWIARAYRKELVAGGAMSRIGKTLVFNRAKFSKWLESRASRVVEFESNNPAIGKSKAADHAPEAA